MYFKMCLVYFRILILLIFVCPSSNAESLVVAKDKVQIEIKSSTSFTKQYLHPNSYSSFSKIERISTL